MSWLWHCNHQQNVSHALGCNCRHTIVTTVTQITLPWPWSGIATVMCIGHFTTTITRSISYLLHGFLVVAVVTPLLDRFLQLQWSSSLAKGRADRWTGAVPLPLVFLKSSNQVPILHVSVYHIPQGILSVVRCPLRRPTWCTLSHGETLISGL